MTRVKSLKFQPGERLHDFHGFEAHGDDSQDQVEDVGGVAVFRGPVVRDAISHAFL